MIHSILATAILATSVQSLAAEPIKIVPDVGGTTCFVRRYDNAHLEKNPDQRVIAIKLRLEIHSQVPDQLYGIVDVTLRGDEGENLWGNGGACVGTRFERPASSAQRFTCNFDADGGQYVVSADPRVKNAILIQSKEGLSLDYSGDDDGDEPYSTRLDPKADGTFRLFAADPGECR